MSNSKISKNDTAWQELFKKYKIIEKIKIDGQFAISAKQINEFREARLMTKFDHKSNLPSLFQEHNISILPITRGDYIIAQFDAYQSFEQKNDVGVEYISFPSYIQSIDFERITSEAIAINCAYVSGIIADFVEDDDLLPTVNGRMSSENFSFKINTFSDSNQININVNNSQMEIDGGYEGVEYLSLIEAKNALSSDFLIRQLYYPHRLWRNKLSKEVKSIFLIYSNGLFTLYEYKFENPNHYNSLVLVKQKHYTLEQRDISLEDIQNIIDTIQLTNEPELPFPQANSFERVINLCELLHEKTVLTKDEITETYDFDERQTNYYTDAARYLGLVDKKKTKDGICFFLTDEGKKLFKLKYKQRQLRLIILLLQHSIFLETIKLWLKKASIPERQEIINIMRTAHLYNSKSDKSLADNTLSRRSSTILGWVNWIINLIN